MFGRKKCPPYPHYHEHHLPLFASKNPRRTIMVGRILTWVLKRLPGKPVVEQAIRCSVCGIEKVVPSMDAIGPAIQHHLEFECQAKDHDPSDV